MNKSLITNLFALTLTIFGYFSPIYSNIIFTTGIFALSGSITNWIAIQMLFEKIPFLYGSGVIPKRFEDFKDGIKNLIINEFFNKEHIEQFFNKNNTNLSAETISNKIDFDKIFIGLTEAIAESSMGSMLTMFGGKEALQPLKEPITNKLKNIITEFAKNNNNSEGDFVQNIITQIEQIIDNRLAQLTPETIKNIIQNMIKKHLGWLVIWGGIFGGLIGLIFSIL